MHPVVIMAYEPSDAIDAAVAALGEAGLTAIVLSTAKAKLVDFLGALAADEKPADDENIDNSGAEETGGGEPAADLPPEPKGKTDPKVEESVIVDGEKIAVKIVEGMTAELFPSGLMVGTKTAYALNESHFAFWPAGSEGMFDLTHDIQIERNGRAMFTAATIKEAVAVPFLNLGIELWKKLNEVEQETELTTDV
jgi:hypothetical protein